MSTRTQAIIPTLEAIPGGKVSADYAGKPLGLSASGLKKLWADGLLNEASYVCLALMLDAPSMEPNTDFDLHEFQEDWVAALDGGKEKAPKIKTIRDVLEKLHEQALANVETRVQLTLSFEKL